MAPKLTLVGGSPPPAAPGSGAEALLAKALDLMRSILATSEQAEREALERAALAERMRGDCLIDQDEAGAARLEETYAARLRDAGRFRAMAVAMRARIADAEGTAPR